MRRSSTTRDNERHWILERTESSVSAGSVDLVDPEDLPTFYTAIRLGPMAVLLAIAGGMLAPVTTEFLKLRVGTKSEF